MFELLLILSLVILPLSQLLPVAKSRPKKSRHKSAGL